MNEPTPKEATTSERYIEVLTELIGSLTNCNQRTYEAVGRLVGFDPKVEKVAKEPLAQGQSFAEAYENAIKRLQEEVEFAISNLEKLNRFV